MFTIRIAELVVGIENRYRFVEKLCRDYICDCPPLFTVRATEEDIDREGEMIRGEAPEGKGLPRGYLESIVLYREIAKRLPEYDAFVFHGVALSLPDGAYLFTAKSGVGKTTHTRLWLSQYPDVCHVLNGDKPIIREIDGVPFVFGTPWQGKENYGTNESAPLRAIAFVHRAEHNRAERVKDPSSVILPLLSQAYVPQSKEATLKVFAIADHILKNTKLFHLYVNMEKEAAEVAYRVMTGENQTGEAL